MPYTLWSRGRLLGESDLDFVQIWENVRFGWFRPSPHGEKLMPVLAGTGAAFNKLAKLMRNPVRDLTRSTADQADGDWPRDIRRTSAYADLASITDQLEAMELELRDPDGKVVPVDDLHIDDIEWKLSLVPKKLRGKSGTAGGAEPWEQGSEPLRYQMQVHLRGVPHRRLHVPGLDD